MIEKKIWETEKRNKMIRAFEEKDKELYLQFTDLFYASDAVLNPVSVQNRLDTFEEMLHYDRYVDGVVIEDEGNPVGFALMAKTYSQEAGGIVVWVEELFILEAYRGKGYGTEFFAYFFEHYKDAKRYRLEVVEDHDKVIKMYERQGFEKFDYMQMVFENN